MRSNRTFTDEKGVTRRNGEEWLIKFDDTETHIPGVYEEVGVDLNTAILFSVCHSLHMKMLLDILFCV